MQGDNYQKISPNDRWIFDAAGNLAGASASNRSDKEARFLPPELSDALASNYGGGAVVAAFGDSITQWNNTVALYSAASFDPTTNLMAVTQSGAHNNIAGSMVDVYHRTYPSLNDLKHATIDSITGSTTYNLLLPGKIGAYHDLPTGALVSGLNFSLYTRTTSKGWFNWWNVLNGRRVRYVINSAQSGDKVEDNIRRYPVEKALWKALGVNTVFMQMTGINNLAPDTLTTTQSVSTLFANMIVLLDMIRNDGFRMILGTPTPVLANEGSSRDKPNLLILIADMARLVRNYGIKYADRVCVVDCYSVVTDPVTGLARTGYVNNDAADRIHPAGTGGFRVAEVEGPKINAFLPGYANRHPRSAIDSRNASKLTLTAQTIDANGLVTLTATNCYTLKDQEIFVSGATGFYGPNKWSGVNGRFNVIATGTGSLKFQTNVTGQAGTITGTLVVCASRQLFPDPLLQTTTGGTANAGGTLTATKIAGQLAVTLTAGVTATADVTAAATGLERGASGSLTLAAPVVAGTSSTLAYNFPGVTAPDYHVRFDDGSTRLCALTNGATTITWIGAVTAGTAIQYTHDPVPDGIGNEQTVTVSVAGNTDNVRVSWKAGVGTVDQYLIPGRKYRLGIRLRLTAAADWANIPIGHIDFYAALTATTSFGSETWNIYDLVQGSTDAIVGLFVSGSPLTKTLDIMTPEFSVPAASIVTIDSFNMNCYTYFMGTISENLVIGVSIVQVDDSTADGPNVVNA